MTYDIQALPGGRRGLVMGMTWQTLLGEHLDKQARATARRNKATYYCRGEARSNVVGMLTLRKGDKQRHLKLFSGAAAFARSQSRSTGVTVARVALNHDRIWISAALNGTVLAGSDRVLSVEEAADHLAELRTRYPNATVYGDGGDYKLDVARLQSNLRDDTALMPARWDWRSVPVPFRWLGLVAVVYLAWDYGSGWWEQRQRQLARAERSSVEVDAAGLWRSSLDQWSRGVLLHGREGMLSLFQQLDSIPLRPGRWQLAQLRCSPTACDATYLRLRLGTRETLKSALPGSWSVTWEGLDTAVARLPLDLPLQPLDTRSLLPLADIDEQFSNSLQRAASLFEGARLNPPLPVPLAPPTVTSTTGARPVDKPPEVVVPVGRSFSMTGPLRSVLALELPRDVAFHDITIRVTDSEPRLSRSRLTAVFEGTYYGSAL